MTEKEMFQEQYDSYIGVLDETSKSIRAIRGRFTKFSLIQEHVLGVLETLLNDSKKQMRQVLGGTVWDKLVIGFFGETNAGKSTIIETFRILFHDQVRESQRKANGGKGVDGLIVGDGRPDFTQVCQEYELEIDGVPFVLIDVPGIEGNEAKYYEEIMSALKKAHCVFYIQGENKKPNAETAGKIRKYLSDWVEVYSIWNVRGSIDNYDEPEDRVQLKNENRSKIEKTIKEAFQQTIGDVYAGHVSVQALLALTALADFHPSLQERIDDQNELLSYFETPERVMEFSRFDDLVSLVADKSKHFTFNIVRSNNQKLNGLKIRIQQAIADCISSQSEEMEGFKKQLGVFKNGIDSVFSSTARDIDNDLRSIANRKLEGLLQFVYRVIDGDGTQSEKKENIEQEVNRVRKTLESAMDDSVEQNIKSLAEKIKVKRKDLDQVPLLSGIQIPSLDIRLNVSAKDILSNLDFDILNDGLKAAAKVATAFGLVLGGIKIGSKLWGAPGAAIGAGVGSLAAIAVSVFGSKDDGRAKARENARKIIYDTKKDLGEEIGNASKNIREKLADEKAKFIAPIDEEIQNLEQLNDEIVLITDLMNT